MNHAQKPPIPWKVYWPFLVFFLGWAVYFVVKVFSPSWITHYYQAQSFDLLNRLSLGEGQASLDFYQGRIQETVFGPFLQCLSYSLLALLLCRYCADVSLRVFAAIIFVFLLITKIEVMFFPPYGDAIGGPFAEALWLYQNSFDYAGLFHQPNFTVGGPRVYFLSIYPGFLALTLKLIPWGKVFLAFHHILTFALTAGIIAMIRECGRKVVEPVLAILMSLILLAMPLYQSQSEAINMEIPVTFFTMWSVFALVRKRWAKSTVLACLAALTKGIGIIACGTAAIVLVIAAIRAEKLKDKLNLGLLALMGSFTAAFVGGAKFFFKDSHIQQGMVHWDAGWPSLQKEFIFYLFLAALAFFILSSILRSRGKGNVLWEKLQTSEFSIPALMFLVAAGWFLLFLNFFAVSPRYRVALYPFLIFSVVSGVVGILKFQLLQRLLAVGVLLAACASSYGSYYGSIPDNDHVQLERSLEYRNDLEVNRRLIRAAEERYHNQLIVAPFTIAQALAIPELGYVHKKCNVMIYGFGLKYGGILNYHGLRYLDPQKTVFVGVKVAMIDPQFPYPVSPKDVILEEFAVGNKKASFFVGGYAIEALWRLARGWSAQ